MIKDHLLCVMGTVVLVAGCQDSGNSLESQLKYIESHPVQKVETEKTYYEKLIRHPSLLYYERMGNDQLCIFSRKFDSPRDLEDFKNDVLVATETQYSQLDEEIVRLTNKRKHLTGMLYESEIDSSISSEKIIKMKKEQKKVEKKLKQKIRMKESILPSPTDYPGVSKSVNARSVSEKELTRHLASLAALYPVDESQVKVAENILGFAFTYYFFLSLFEFDRVKKLLPMRRVSNYRKTNAFIRTMRRLPVVGGKLKIINFTFSSVLLFSMLVLNGKYYLAKGIVPASTNDDYSHFKAIKKYLLTDHSWEIPPHIYGSGIEVLAKFESARSVPCSTGRLGGD